MSTVSNVTVGKPNKTGAIFVAPLGTPLPTSVSEAKNVAFTNVGYISEDGVTNTNTATNTTQKAWGGSVVLVTQDEKPDMFKFTMIETLGLTPMEVVYGKNNVSGNLSTGITVTANGDAPDDMSWIIDMVMRNGVLKRIVIPNASVDTVEDIVYKDNEIVGYPVTISAKPDSSNNTHYEYIKEPAATYTVTFDSNEGSAVAAQTVTAGSTATQPANPTRTGYTFVEWCSDELLTTAFDFTTAINANITLYAKWSQD